MNRFFFISVFTCFLFILVSCDNGSKEKCAPGYTWDGTECKKDETSNPDNNQTGDLDNSIPDNDSNSPDVEGEDSEVEDNENAYTGDCIEIKNGGTFEINITTKTLTIGKVTLNGKTDDTNLYGELWGENESTLSEFKIADVDENLSGKKFKIPEGRYSFSFKATSFDNKINILEDIDMSQGDRTLDFDIPLFHFTGSVLKNGAAFNVEAGMEDSTKITIKSGTFEKIVPYSDFNSFDVVLPKGKYSVYFEGQLSAGQQIYKGTVISSNNGISIEDDIDQDINIETVTYSGNAVNEGYDVNAGQIVLVENPPFDNISSVLIADLANKAYSVTVTKGALLNVLFLPEIDSYPVKYVKIETWEDFSQNKNHDIKLDLGRIHGTITFLGGTNLPSVSNCNGADCTRGKLKIVGFDYSSLLIKDFGVEGGDLNYEAFVVRGTKQIIPDPTEEDPDRTKEVYYPKIYTMNFESHLNDIAATFEHSPFTLPLKYLNNQNTLVSNFDFLNVSEEPIPEKEINFNITPSLVEGTVTLNGTAIKTDKSDLIKLKSENGEIPVVDISKSSDGTFSFFAPNGEYSVIYEGNGVLGSEYRTVVENIFNINGNMSGQNFALTTSKIFLDITVNGKSFKEWIENTKNLSGHSVVINPDKTGANYFLNTVKQTDGPYFAEILSGITVNGYLELYFVNPEKDEPSFSRIPVLISHNVSSDKTVNLSVSLTEFSTSIKLNGNSITGAKDYLSQLIINGQNRTEIFYPSSSESVKGFYKSGEHKSPRPELLLNDGFDTKQKIELQCLYFGE